MKGEIKTKVLKTLILTFALVQLCSCRQINNSENNTDKDLRKLPAIKQLILDTEFNPRESLEEIELEATAISNTGLFPVYKTTNDAKADSIVNKVLSHFDMDIKYDDFETEKIDMTIGNRSVYVSRSNDQTSGKIEVDVYSYGTYSITLDFLDNNNADFGFCLPKTDSEEVLKEYLLNYVSEHQSLFNINGDEIIIDVLHKDSENNIISFHAAIRDNVPKDVVEKYYPFNEGNYKCLAILIWSDYQLMISHTDRKNVSLVDYYPVISYQEAIDKYSCGDFICYDTKTAKMIESEFPGIQYDYKDTFLDFRLVYEADENDFTRPVYHLLFRTSGGLGYYVGVDAIKPN